MYGIKNHKKALFSATLAAILATGCATTADSPDERLVRLRAELDNVTTIDQANRYAPIKLREAEESLDKLEALLRADAEPNAVSHQVYLVDRKIDIAAEMARMKASDEIVEQADAKRKNLIIAARTSEAQKASMRAQQMDQRAKDSAAQAKESAERARLAEERAQAAEAYAQQMATRANKLENDLQNISTEQTERGLVLTLGNILFEVDKATIKSGSERTLQRVADFLNEYPKRKVLIEGFTDNTGADSYNQDLSERRAASVKDTLVQGGVDESRVRTRGYGEAHAVANNDSQAGRLQNRRVEIIIADEGEEVSDRDS
ncbi:OmpA family protein [Gilvimarinus polysaccharolyticus]|uniref:OmpA family protein n=1 Tax=Gilvimarinus polysaccharolyticus TaxID=863921 RepID=UPI0006736E78|nr:OmpA family protein [Gilvimarinus polysaccharolyticus]